jgi:hypothetical protein
MGTGGFYVFAVGVSNGLEKSTLCRKTSEKIKNVPKTC